MPELLIVVELRAPIVPVVEVSVVMLPVVAFKLVVLIVPTLLIPMVDVIPETAKVSGSWCQAGQHTGRASAR